LVTVAAASLAAVLLALSLHAQQPKSLPGSEVCLGCHETGRRTGKRQPGIPPPFNEAALQASPPRHTRMHQLSQRTGRQKGTSPPRKAHGG
jgi:hypothetical protein